MEICVRIVSVWVYKKRCFVVGSQKTVQVFLMQADYHGHANLFMTYIAEQYIGFI